MLHIGSATAREQRLPAADPIVHQGRFHAEQGAVVGCVRAVVAPPARSGAAAADGVRARGARIPAERRRALVRRRHALLAQPGLLRGRLSVLQPAQRLLRAVVPAAAAHGVRDAAVAAGQRVPRGLPRRVPRAARLPRTRPALGPRLPRAAAPRRLNAAKRPFRLFIIYVNTGFKPVGLCLS